MHGVYWPTISVHLGPCLPTSYLYSVQRLASDMDDYCHNVIFIQLKKFSFLPQEILDELSKKKTTRFCALKL